MRDKDTPNALFRQELERIGTLLIAEATRGLATHEVRVTTPLVATSGRALSSQPVVVPVLRAGLGFVHAAQELLPSADVGFIGVSRDEETFQPKPYVNKLPEFLAGRQCIVLDPMLPPAVRWRTHASCCWSAAPPAPSSSCVCSPRPKASLI